MKYVAILDVKNTASFFMSQFRGVETGEGAAIETCEGITFFRATSFELTKQLAYFAKIQDFLLKEGTSGLAAAVIPPPSPADENDLVPFCEGIKAISPSIVTIYVRRADNIWNHLALDHSLDADSENLKGEIKNLVGISPTFDDGSHYHENPLSSRAREIRRSIDVCNI